MRIIYTGPALHDLARLPKSVRSRIFTKLHFYAAQLEPLTFAERLTGFHAYRFRIGVHRVFFDVNEAVLVILAVRKRDKAYRGLE